MTGGAAGVSAANISGTIINTTTTAQTATYTVTPTSGTCAGTTFTLTVTINIAPSITAMTNTVCSGVAFTSTPANGTNGVVPTGTTYSWSAPTVTGGMTGGALGSAASSMTGTLTNTTNTAQTATYIVTPTSGTCAGTTFTLTVTINPKPTITAMTNTVCSGVAFTSTPANGTNGVVPTGTTYSWSAPTVTGGMTGGVTGSAASSLTGTLTNTTNTVQTATYTVTPTSGSCSGTTFTVTVTVNPTVTFTPSFTNPTVCNATDGTITLSGLQANTSYTYTLNGGSSVPATSSSTGQIIISSLSATTYAIIVTNATSGCSSIAQSVSLTNPGAPDVNDIADQALCGGSYTLPVITGTNLNGNQAYYTGPNGTGSVMSGSISTSQTIYIYASTPGGCSDQETFTVTINPLPTITGTLTVCVGSTTQLTGSGTANATTPWTSSTSVNATVSSTGLVSGLSVGSTTITYMDNNGCQKTAIVTVNSLPTFTATPTDPTLCNGTNGSILLTGLQNSTSYTYSLNGAAAVAVTTTASGQATISSLGAGTYTLTVTLVSTGCISATQTVSLTNPGAPNVNDITDQVLCGGSYTLPVITGTNLSGNQSYYTGTNGTGTPIAEGTVISASQTIYIYASTPGGCSDQETFSVTINALPTITGTLTVCVGSTIQLTGSGIANATTPWTSSTPVNATVSSTGLVSGLSVGSTTITYMDNNGCQKTAIVTVNSLPTFTATPTDPTLCNGTNGSILLTGLQNSTSYTYSLNGAAAVAVTTTASGQATISSLGAGTYTLTVTLVSTGCISATQTVSLTNPGAPNVNDIIDQVLCGGSYTLPVITGTNLSGNQSYYTGTNGTGTPIAALTVISTSQTIYIYASTPGGCSDQETFTVTINPLPTISGTLSVCVGSTIQLTGSGTANATTPWTSSIPANATVNSTGLVTGVAVGNTTITYTDNNGCITTAVVTVNPVPTFTATPTNPTLCNGTDGSILLTGLQNSTSYTYSLNGAAAVAFTTSASGQATISSLGAGTYTLTVTMVSTGGVSATQTLSLTNPGAPNVNDITDQVLCGGSYTLPLITGTNLNGNQAYYTGPNGTGSVLSGSISTSQTVYIYASTPGGCSDEETFMVTINALPTISGTLTVCIGSTTQLTGSGTANATTPWTSSTPANATVSSTGLVSGLSVGSTTITYMDNNGCITTAVVTVNSLPTFTATPTDPTLCNGTNGSILLTGLQNSTSYTYSLNGAAAVAVTTTASGQATISSLGSGTYTLTVTLVSTGCISATQTTSLTNPGAPNVNDIIDQVLCGGSYTLPVITGTNLNGNQAYYSQPNGPNGTGSALTGSISTSQTVYIYASTPGGCSDEETFSVTIQTIPTLSAGSTLCVGNTLQLSASTVGTWVSNTPSIASVIPATGVATGLLSGNATFTFTDASTGCTATTSTVSVNATPTVNAGTDVTICSSTGFVSLSGSFGGSASSVNWTGGNGGVFSSPASVISLYTFSSTDISSGSVWLYLTTNDPAGDCSFVKDSLLVTINPSAIVNAGVDQVTCGTTSVSLSGTVGGSATSVTWSTSNGTGIFSSLNALNASYTPSNNDIATVYINIVLTSNDPLGPCPAVTDTVVISVDPPATANAGIDFVSCSNTPINLNGLFGGSASTGIWTGSSNPVVNNPTTSNVIYTPSVSELSIGSVTLTFTTNDPAGSCLAVSDQVTISFSSPAIVNAGNDTTICSGSTIGLNGTFGGLATSATWFSAGTPPGVFTGSSLYTPSQAEITVGTAVLTYTTNNPAGPCPAVSDQKIITINPTPTVSGLNAITVCSGTALNHLLSGVVSSNYTWIAADNTQTIGETTTLQTTSSITDVIINQTTIDQVLVYTITPTAVGTGCVGSPQTLTVTVKPTPTLIDPADQTLCAYTSTQSVSFASNLAGTTFSWAVTPANLNIGLSNDTGNSIPSFTAQNTFTTTINATVTVTPTSNSSCAGTPQTFDFIILPVSTVVDPSDQVVCAGTLTSTITFIGSDPATIYNWTSNNTTIGVSLSSPGAGNISAFAGVNNGITDVISTFTVTPSLNGCLGTPQTFTIKVKPLPTMQTPASQTVCVGNSTSQVVFASSILGTTYSWTNSNSNIGLAGASVGNVTFIPSFVSQNSTNLIDTADIIVIPSFNGCAGTAVSFQIIVNPVLQVTPITNVVYCAGDLFPGVSFTGNVPTASYSWSTDNISVGFPISGQSNVPGINSFTTQNSGSLTQIANVTVTPSLPGCQGTPFIFTLTVKPLPTVFIAPLSQAHCHGSSTIPVDFTGNLDPVVTYTWSQDNTSISAVFLGSGTNDIPSFIAINTGLVSQTSTFIVVPTYNGCTGIQATFSITVNPIPTVANVLDQNWCAGQPSDPVNFTGSLGSTATYNWTQTNQYIGINTPPAFGDIASFTTQNLSTIIQTDTITVTPNFNGCNGIPEVFVITVRPTPTVYPINDQSLCVYTYTNPVVFNGNMGSVATYSWTNNNTVINSSISSGNDSIPSFQVQNPGNTIVVATITVTPEAYGCFGTPETFTISSVDPIPTVIPTADITLCAGTQTGTIDFQPNDPTIIYHWTNDNTSIGLASAGATDISNFQLQNTGIANQTAHVIVTPEYNGCFGLSDTFDITVKPIPNVFITPLYDSLCANQNSAYIDFTGDISGTNFSWINSNTSIGLSGSGSGDIPSFLATNISNNIETGIITVTPDFNGCSGTPQTTTITVNPISTVVLATQPIYYCHGDSISDIIFNGNNSGTIYQWTNNNTAINLPSSGVGNILSFPVTNTDVVNYEAIIAVQPVLNGCPGVLDSFKIIVKPIPTVYTPLNQFLCANQASTVVDFQGNMTDSTVFTWFNTNVSIGLLNPTITGGSGNIPSFVATNVGQLTQVADVIVIPTLNGCIGIADTFQYTAYPISTVNLVNDTVCTGDFVNQLDFVGSNPTATYEWTCYNNIGLNPLTGLDSIPGFTAFNSGTVQQDGLIVVTPYVGGCPGINDTLHIVVNPRPIINASLDQTVCANDVTDPVVFSSNISGTTYAWQNSNISIGLASSDITDIATFTSINTDATGLIPQIGTIIVTPSFNGCAGLNDTLSITVNPLPVVNAGLDTTLCFGQHVTLTGSGTAISYLWDNGALNGIPYYPTTTTLFTVVGTDNNLCQNTDQILVTYLLDLPPVVSAGPDTAICFSEPITLNGVGNALVYNWNNDVLDGQSFNPAQTDTYIVIGTAANGCIASDTMELIVHPLPIVSINVVDSILCAGEQALLWGSGALTYVWDNNITDNVPFIPTETDIYTMIGYDQFGCTDTASITVVVNPMPNVLFSSDMNFGGCLPFSPTFTDLTGANGNGPTSASVMWYFGNGASSNQLGSETNIYDSYGCFDVTLVSTTAEACTDSLTLQDYVCVNELVASFTPDPLSQPISNPVFEFTNTSVNATEFQWFFGDGTESDFVSTKHTYDSIGCYQVVLVVSAQDGCTDTAVQVVCVKDELLIYVPNTFTPDGDGLNDIFLPVLTAGYRPGTYEFAIYNRWGERFFYTEDVDQGWDGTFKGNEVQVGTYTYTIKFKSSMDNNVYTFNGHVNLIR
jgi:gliding motility-associated-like protein